LETRSEFEHLKGSLAYIAIILDMHNAQLIRSRIVTTPFIRSIATLIDVCDVCSFTGAEEFLNALLLICENLSSNTKVLLQMHEPIMNHMLPVLLSKIQSESADIRFLSLKIFTDIMIQYLHDDSIYDNMGTGGNQTTKMTKQVDDLILHSLLPSFTIILKDQDPVPLFGLKLLAAVVERNSAFIPVIKNFGLFGAVTDFYTINSPKLNRHTIKIVKAVVESK
jgi:serine/threonine-protein kinase ULK4